MSGFLEKYNTDDVFLRGLISSFLLSLNNKLRYYQTNDKQELLEVFVPFYYSMTGDEAFLQDFFLQYTQCLTDKPIAEGNYDVIPRGIINIGASQIDTSALTNKYVRMTYTKESKEGEMKAFSSFTNSIPLNLTFEITIKTDTMLDAFKIYQNVIEVFYKTYTFSFLYSGQRIPCQVGFPDSYETMKQLEFSYQNSPQLIEFKFSVNVETYFPERDLTTEKFRGNLMQAGIKMNQVISDKTLPPDESEIL